jgi:hypothetical protein
MRRSSAWLLAGGCIWLAGVAAGFHQLWLYSGTPGAAAAPSSIDWPPESRIERSRVAPTLVMFLHPHCPCSFASMNELDRILTDLGGTLAAHAIVVRPRGVPEGWERGRIFDRARELKGVSVEIDEGGVEAHRFGAETSGYVLLYDSSGRLVFRGGITAARGHEGENVGSERIVSLARTGHADKGEAAVFGCGLKDPE